MTIASLRTQAEFGIPIKKVELDVQKKRESFKEISMDLVQYGRAANTVLEMQKLFWYLTDQDYLVCSEVENPNFSGDADTLKLRLFMDDNLAWFVMRTRKLNWEDFGIPIRVVENHIDQCKMVVFLDGAVDSAANA